MQNKLKDFLAKKGYTKIKLKLTKTNHFEVKAKINNVKGTFILDTGASKSCVDINASNIFLMKTKKSSIKISGASGAEMKTKKSKKNRIKIGQWNGQGIKLVLIDLSQINTALKKQNAKPVQGIIGADILKKANGIIDYKKQKLYLKF